MMIYPELLSETARQHVDQLIGEASRYRLAAALRRSRRRLGPEDDPSPAQAPSPAKTERELVGAASRLAPCDAPSTDQVVAEPAATALVR